jgi:hypothetical protein
MASAETLGEAWSWGWGITIRCLNDGREGMKHKRGCTFRQDLDLRCPRCGCRDVAVMFSNPFTAPAERGGSA